MPSEAQNPLADAYLQKSRRSFAASFAKIQHCVDQLSDEQVWWRSHESQNSIGNILLHLCGNLGQWIMHGVGGEVDVRDRPVEFSERGAIAKGELLRQLTDTMTRVDTTLAKLSPKDLLESRRVQGFDESVLSAIYDTATHMAGHMQEIVFITRMQLGDAYEFHWQPTTPEQGAGP